jgi:hypothetical protein
MVAPDLQNFAGGFGNPRSPTEPEITIIAVNGVYPCSPPLPRPLRSGLGDLYGQHSRHSPPSVVQP